jgi:hypothetical protein
MEHDGDARAHAVAQRLVPVAGEAGVVALADGDAGRAAAFAIGRLGRGVDAAAGGAAAEGRAGRSLEHFDLAIVERVARVDAEVAQAVGEDVVLGGDAADEELVAAHHPAFADLGGDARHVAQRLFERGHALLFQRLARDHVDDLGGVLRVDGRNRGLNAAAEDVDAVALASFLIAGGGGGAGLRVVSGSGLVVRGGDRVFRGSVFRGGLGEGWRQACGGEHEGERCPCPQVCDCGHALWPDFQ